MRCRFCGSRSIHQDTQHKTFSAGKAAAGVAVLGVYGAAAGFIGKDQKGYRCVACGAFMDVPMDMVTESALNEAVIAAQNGDRRMYDYYKKQYSHMEDVAMPEIVSDKSTREYIKLQSPTISFGEDKTIDEAVLKHGYRNLSWDCSCPIYCEAVYIFTKCKQDYLRIDAVNVGNKDIRSAYFQIKIFDDAGDSISDRQCVYQNQTAKPGENLSKDTDFPLNTDIAYRVWLVCEKVSFTDDSVWRKDGTAEPIQLKEQIRLSEESFPRYKYLKNALTDESPYNYANGIYLPCKTDYYWTCVCGIPVLNGRKCARCGFVYDRVEELASQKELRDRQKAAVRSIASSRARGTMELYKVARDEEYEIEYKKAKNEQRENSPESLEKAVQIYESISEYKDSAELAKQCRDKIPVRKEELRIQNEKRKKEEQKRDEERRIRDEELRIAIEAEKKRRKKRNKIAISIVAPVIIMVVLLYVCKEYVIPLNNYNKAQKLYEEGNYSESRQIFSSLGEYNDSPMMSKKAYAEELFHKASLMHEHGKLQSAYKTLNELIDYIEAADFSSEYYDDIKSRTSVEWKEVLYKSGISHMKKERYKDAINCFESIEDYKTNEDVEKYTEYKDVEEKMKECQNAIKDEKYNTAVKMMNDGNYKGAIAEFKVLDGFKDSEDQIKACKAAEKEKENASKYDSATKMMEEGDYEGAITAFKTLDGYKDSEEQISVCKIAIKDAQYDSAVSLMKNNDYEAAIAAFNDLNGHKDSEKMIKECENEITKKKDYTAAMELMKEKKYVNAIAAFDELDGYKDSEDQADKCKEKLYNKATKYMNKGEYHKAIATFDNLDGYKDIVEMITTCKDKIYAHAEELMEKGSYKSAIEEFESLEGFKDSSTKIEKCKENMIFEQYAKNVGEAYFMSQEHTLSQQNGYYVIWVKADDDNVSIGHIEKNELGYSYGIIVTRYETKTKKWKKITSRDYERLYTASDSDMIEIDWDSVVRYSNSEKSKIKPIPDGTWISYEEAEKIIEDSIKKIDEKKGGMKTNQDINQAITNIEMITKVQEILNAAGYDCGSPDGTVGNQTKSAVTTYQLDHDMEATGIIDRKLLESLGLVIIDDNDLNTERGAGLKQTLSDVLNHNNIESIDYLLECKDVFLRADTDNLFSKKRYFYFYPLSKDCFYDQNYWAFKVKGRFYRLLDHNSNVIDETTEQYDYSVFETNGFVLMNGKQGVLSEIIDGFYILDLDDEVYLLAEFTMHNNRLDIVNSLKS